MFHAPCAKNNAVHPHKCAISLTSTGSLQNGVRVCVSQMNREEQYDLLDRRLRDFAQDYARK